MIADQPVKKIADVTRRVAILVDESGSMDPHRGATIEATNAYIGSLKELPGTTLVTLAQFDKMGIEPVVRFRCVDVAPENVPLLDIASYKPRGYTPLFDALARVILSGDAKTPTLIVINTDGFENASIEYTTSEAIRKLVKEREAGGWTFVYLGAGMDRFTAEQGAGSIGAALGSTQSYARGQESRAAQVLAGSTYSWAANTAVGQSSQDFYAEAERDLTKEADQKAAIEAQKAASRPKQEK